jgi:hypothetical protein
MTTTYDAITALSRAAGALTLSAERSPGAPLSWLEPEIATLDRAMTRMRVLLATHPELKVDQPMPAGSLREEDMLDRARVIDALQTAAAMPSEPVTVRLVAIQMVHDDTYEAVLREFLDQRVVVAVPNGDHYTADVGSIARDVAERFLPEAIETY